MPPSEAERLLVLLRGINVGGHHSVAMADLRALFIELGCSAVATYIQSGNLVCTAPPALTSDRISAELASRFGFPVPVMLRTRQQLDTAIASDPFAAPSSNPAAKEDARHMVFLSAPLTPAALQRLEAACTGEERLHVHAYLPDTAPAALPDFQGCEIFLYLPYGTGRSRLAAACTAAAIPGNPTIRNWRTVLQLQSMLQAD